MSVARLTVSLPEPVVKMLENLAARFGTTKSETVARLIVEREREELEAAMAEGYQAMDRENITEVDAALFAQSEVARRD